MCWYIHLRSRHLNVLRHLQQQMAPAKQKKVHVRCLFTARCQERQTERRTDCPWRSGSKVDLQESGLMQSLLRSKLKLNEAESSNRCYVRNCKQKEEGEENSFYGPETVQYWLESKSRSVKTNAAEIKGISTYFSLKKKSAGCNISLPLSFSLFLLVSMWFPFPLLLFAEECGCSDSWTGCIMEDTG